MTDSRVLVLALALTSLAVSACARDGGEPQQDPGSPAAAALETLPADTLFVLGGIADRGLQLNQLGAAVLLPDGSAVLSHGDGLFLIGPSGEVIRRVAGVGDGPGEVQGVRSLEWHEPTQRLLYYDGQLRRITRLDLASGSAETRPVRVLPFALSTLPLPDWGTLFLQPASRSRLLGLRREPRLPDGVHAVEDTLLIEAIDSAGRSVRLLTLPDGLRYSVVTGNATNTYGAPGGRSAIAAMAGGKVAHAYNDDARVTLLDPAGGGWSADAGVPRAPMTDEAWKGILEAFTAPPPESDMAGLPQEIRDARLRQRQAPGYVPSPVRIAEVAERPEWQPLFDRMHLSLDGEVWLRERVLDDAQPSARWIVVGERGALRSVSLPSDLRMLSIRGRRILASVSGELGVPSLLALSVRDGG